MTLFEKWKKEFDAWEVRAADLSKKVLGSPVVLEPTGALLTAAMRTKARTDRVLGDVWSAVGLPNRRDQERTLRLLTVLERRVIDLEEKLEDAHEELRRARGETR
ncbi:hypothetical protein [Sandaracinus amylolyticus]|uniref:hypothetical protein n=1 Tax=Sandaracinus amylolyticus TaxID=927083 RepID=UPI001F2F32A2|nr:hypothetical protein [Sandaracinus amylolyticus]UJR85368.1 Hypothetical protein I5071_74480 [Sandaracinus amylolyticus]